MSKAAQNQSDFDLKRREIFANRPLAIAYLNIVNRVEGLLSEARGSIGGNIALEKGKASSGLEVAGDAVGAVSSIAGAFISAASKIAGFFHKKDIKNTHANTIDVAGDATREDWSTFARELAATIVLQNQAHFQEGVQLNKGVEPHRKSAVSPEDRAKIEKKSKEVFGQVVGAINSDRIEVDPELGITDKNSRENLIEQLSNAARTPTKQELAKEAIGNKSGNHHKGHEDCGIFTHSVIDREKNAAQAPAVKAH